MASSRVVFSVVVAVSSAVAVAAPAFPISNPWVVVRNAGVPVQDSRGDVQGARDLVGDPNNPLLHLTSDATHLAFRLRVDTSPLQNATNFAPFGWGCLISTDTNPTTYEFSVFVDGLSNPDQVMFFRNTTTLAPNSLTDQPDLPARSQVQNPLMGAVGHAQVVMAPSMFGGDPDFFIEWAVERSALLADGFDPSQPARYLCGASNDGMTIGSDCAGSTGGCVLDSGLSDPMQCGATGCSTCADGEVGFGEGCDDGNLVSGDGCSALCLRELAQPCTLSSACASGYCDPAGNVCACDQNADCAAPRLCNVTANPNQCVMPGCGNGVLEAGEGCEDGNQQPGDGCSAACLRELGQPCTASAVCQSGFCDPSANVCACDQSADCPAGQQCNTVLNPNQCVPAGCGNGVLEAGEGCDDGNLTGGDGCSPQCRVELGSPCQQAADCASGFCEMPSSRCACNADADCPPPQLCRVSTTPRACVAPGCGNGVLELTERCDDGNTMGGDGCSAQCLLELGARCNQSGACQSGFCDPSADVCACDEAADCGAGQSCRVASNPNQCVAVGCGNGVVESGEGCDDGNTAAGDGCDGMCVVEPVDAGAPDAGGLDAGAPDAGAADAGGIDAGEGELDAGTPDAGLVDAGIADAGGIDAGEATMDAGLVDAGMMTSDGGTMPVDAGMAADAGVEPIDMNEPGGCSCGAVPVAEAALFAWALLGLAARRRRG